MNGELHFTRTALEFIRQKTGKDLEAEFEYIFGDEQKFEAICKEALGEKFIQILHYQSEEEFWEDKLASCYNYDPNVLLGNIILENGEDFYVENKRDDGSYNVLNLGNGLLKTIYTVLDVQKRANLEGIDLYESLPEQLSALLGITKELSETDSFDYHMRMDVKKRIVKGLIKNNLSFADFMKVKNSLGSLDDNFWDEFLLPQLDNLDINELENCSQADLFFIVQAIVKATEENEKFLSIINQIDDIYQKRGYQGISPTTDLLFHVAKVKLDTDNFQENFTEMLNSLPESNIHLMNVYNPMVIEGFNRFLNTKAFDNPKALKEIVSTLKNAEYKYSDDSYLLDILIKPLNIEYFKWLMNDVIDIEIRQNPVEDLMVLYRQYKDEIPEYMMSIYNQEMSNFEKLLNEGKIDHISEEAILILTKMQPENKDLQVLLEEALKQKYSKKGLTTERFIEETASSADRVILTKAYLASIGKGNDSVQLQALLELQKRATKGANIPLPQYLPINHDNFIIVSNIEGNFCVCGANKDYVASETLLEAQNKKKRGIFSLFKKKEDKELIMDAIVLDSSEGRTKVLNRFETGRLEIAQLDTSRENRIKTIEKEEIVPIDIGNNGALAVTKQFVKKAFVKYQSKVKQNKSEKRLEDRSINVENNLDKGVK